MKVFVENIKTYILHCPKYPTRWISIEKICAGLGLSYEQILSNTTQYTHQKNVANDSLYLVNRALSNNNYPFLILEDDASIISTIPLEVNIPNDAILVYWGSNKRSGPPVLKNKLRLENFDESYYRIYNSQSSHAILVPNKESAIFLASIYQNAFDTNSYHDVLLPNISKDKIFLTPKNGPYFYQNDGRNNNITKFKWTDLEKVNVKG